jgi:demethylmenaquinone methyltransferase/2-methoxy-6-polyprenyl-1,4-benzoquinol methylase
MQGSSSPFGAQFKTRENIQGIFSRVAGYYDVMNDIMSFGLHREWKRAMIRWMAPTVGSRLLDVAGGTGDLSFRFLKQLDGDGIAVIADFTEDMLHAGQQRPENNFYEKSLSWVCADAMFLPFSDSGFDVVTIGFGLRNVTEVEKALEEMYRMLNPQGGRFLCLEFSKPDILGWDRLYDLYSQRVIPQAGKKLFQEKDAYQYLVESIRAFPNQEKLAAMIRDAGFKNVSYRNFCGGIAAIHSGWRLE